MDRIRITKVFNHCVPCIIGVTMTLFTITSTVPIDNVLTNTNSLCLFSILVVVAALFFSLYFFSSQLFYYGFI